MKQEERRKILNLLAEGKISSEEADTLLSALEKEMYPPEIIPITGNTQNSATGTLPTHLRVQIGKHHKPGDKVNIRIPLNLIKAGVKLAALMPEEAREKANRAMKEKGLGFDLETLSKQTFDEILQVLKDLHIDIESGKDTIKIFCE